MQLHIQGKLARVGRVISGSTLKNCKHKHHQTLWRAEEMLVLVIMVVLVRKRTRRKRKERRGKGGGRGEREERKGGEPKQDKGLRRKGRVTNFSTQVKYKQNVNTCFWSNIWLFLNSAMASWYCWGPAEKEFELNTDSGKNSNDFSNNLILNFLHIIHDTSCLTAYISTPGNNAPMLVTTTPWSLYCLT